MENFINFWRSRGSRCGKEGSRDRVMRVTLTMTVKVTSVERPPALFF